MAILKLHRHGAPPLEIDRDRVLVGRDPACDVVIDDKSVSRRHAALERRGPGFVVVDQGSANGSFVNGEQVSEAALYDGQELRLGMVPFRVQIESEVEGTVLMNARDLGAPATMMMPSQPAAAAPPAYAPAPAAPAYAPPPAAYAPPPPAAAPPPAYAAPAAAYEPPAPAYAPPAPASPRDQAAELLGLPPHASPAEVKARVAEVTADLEARLANARTPNLKATYQKNLDDVKRAAEVLAPGMAAVDAQDLPSVQPTVVPDEMDISIPAPVRAALVHLDEGAPERQSGVPALSTTVLSFTIMILLAACAYFSLSKGKITKELKANANLPEFKLERDNARKFAPMDTLEKAGALKNGTLKLCNKSGQDLQALWLGAVYGLPDKDGNLQIKSYNSQFCPEEFKLTVPAGAQVPVRMQGSSEFCNWDGQGLFASLIFQDPRHPDRSLYVARPIHNSDACIEVGEGL
jgi:hypothetical protein